VVAQDDANVFGKVGTSGSEFMKALEGKKVRLSEVRAVWLS